MIKNKNIKAAMVNQKKKNKKILNKQNKSIKI